MAIPHFPTRRDGRVVREENSLAVLMQLRMFGHLRRAEVAKAVWPNATGGSAYEMACRTLRAMKKDGLVLERENSLGGHSFVLAQRGAAILQEHDLPAQGGYNLAFDGPQFFHRMLGTNYLLEKAREGLDVQGEYAILTGLNAVNRSFLQKNFNKVPDGLMIHPKEATGYLDGSQDADWVEVESAYKPYEELEKALLLFTRSPLLNAEGNLRFNKLVFVYDSRQRHEGRIVKAAQRFLPKFPSVTPAVLLENVIMAECEINAPLAFMGMRERTLGEAMGLAPFQDKAYFDDIDA